VLGGADCMQWIGYWLSIIYRIKLYIILRNWKVFNLFLNKHQLFLCIFDATFVRRMHGAFVEYIIQITNFISGSCVYRISFQSIPKIPANFFLSLGRFVSNSWSVD